MLTNTEILSRAPLIGDEQIALLEKLSNAGAVSGDEGEVRAIVLEAIKTLGDDCRVDTLGNVLAVKKAKIENPLRVMVTAHMDEVGLMLINKDEGGLFNFEKIGGLDVRQMVGKPVLVGKKHVPGVIGARPIHLTTAEERGRAIPLDALRIDVGPSGTDLVKVGERAVFATRFRQVGPSLLGKALDDRIGVVTLIELIRHAPGNIELLAVFTVQEEIGLRGARVAAYALNPDAAIVLDCTPAHDLPVWDGTENARYNTRLGAGPAVYVADGTTLGDPRLVRLLLETSDVLGIPSQLRQPAGGGTDAGTIHRQRAGIPSISLSVPGRYLHTAVGMVRLEDWKNALALAFAALCRIERSLLAGDRR